MGRCPCGTPHMPCAAAHSCQDQISSHLSVPNHAAVPQFQCTALPCGGTRYSTMLGTGMLNCWVHDLDCVPATSAIGSLPRFSYIVGLLHARGCMPGAAGTSVSVSHAWPCTAALHGEGRISPATPRNQHTGQSSRQWRQEI